MRTFNIQILWFHLLLIACLNSLTWTAAVRCGHLLDIWHISHRGPWCLLVQYIRHLTAVSFTSHSVERVSSHLSGPRSLLCGSRAPAAPRCPTAYASLVNKKGWLWWSGLVYWQRMKETRERREVCLGGLQERMCCSNKRSRLQTVNPITQSQNRPSPARVCVPSV